MKRFCCLIAGALLLAACNPNNGGSSEETGEWAVSPAELSFDNVDASNKIVTVTASGDWTATPSAAWIHVKPLSGTGNGSFTVTADAYESGNIRSGSITVSGAKTLTVQVTQGKEGLTPVPVAFDGTKRASTTYQLLVYSFADSDGDGIGDFKGIEQRLDYLDALGVTALWLSPIHPADSYHGYDVTDYYTVNPAYGTEADFQSLVKAAEAKGIRIYLDYVLNHTGKGHPWFIQALADPSSQYRDYYFISSNPAADYKNFPMLKGTTYKQNEWKSAVSGTPRITISKTTEAVTTGNANWDIWFWQGGGEGKALRFKEKGDGTYYLVLEVNGSCGLLLRKGCDWSGKFGAKTKNAPLTLDTPMDLVANGEDIAFTGNGRYKLELSNVSGMESLYFMGAFGDWMPDLNYGDIASVAGNACFQDMAASADKWIGMGIGGFRLDAVKHICGGIESYNNPANRNFLKAWYERCNATYKAAGHSDNIFMVGEVWDNHDSVEKYYYEGLTSCFEFGYWPVLYKALTTGNAGEYVSKVSGFVKDHSAIRPDAQTSLFMTNHDKSSQKSKQIGDSWFNFYRAADDLGRDLAKEKQAAAMLLSSPGKPFIYQGEELGYWRDDTNGDDEYLRAPIVWDKAATQVAKKGVNNKVDNSMLTGSISVETQLADTGSLLNVYKTWSQLRNTYSALAEGEMTDAGLSGSSIAAWYMTAGSQKLLVIHNVGGSPVSVTVNDSMDKPVALLGTASAKGTALSLGSNSSVVFQL